METVKKEEEIDHDLSSLNVNETFYNFISRNKFMKVLFDDGEG